MSFYHQQPESSADRYCPELLREISPQECEEQQQDPERCESCGGCEFYIPFIMFQMREQGRHK